MVQVSLELLQIMDKSQGYIGAPVPSISRIDQKAVRFDFCRDYSITATKFPYLHNSGQCRCQLPNRFSMLAANNRLITRKDKLWKMWFIGQGPYDTHLDRHKGIGVPVYDGFGMIDLQAMHCTTGQFRTEIHPDHVTPKVFTPQYMRAVGR